MLIFLLLHLQLFMKHKFKNNQAKNEYNLVSLCMFIGKSLIVDLF